MISGALLLSKKQDITSFYKKRFGRILIPTIIWSIIYIFYDSFIDNGCIEFYDIITKILLIPFQTQTGLLWFMYVLIGIYLVAPILSYWLSECNKKDVEIVLGLWGGTLLLPYLTILNQGCNDIRTTAGPLYHFYGFLGYALLGYYLKKYNTWKNTSWQFITMLLVSLAFPVIVFFTGILPLSVLDGSNNLAKVMLSASAFIFFRNLSYKPSQLLDVACLFAKYSYGIYLSHILFLKPIRIYLTQYHINYLIQMPLTALFVGLVSFVFVYLISKLPKSKYIIG